MSKKKRDNPFVWPTWISKLVAGEDQCVWKYWFKSHFMYDKAPGDFNLARWTVNHTTLVRSRRDALERLGFKVFIEDQNSFKYEFFIPKKLGTWIPKEGEKITISGKADIVAIGREEDEKITGKMHEIYLVEDAKTGNPKTSDHIQVMLYMMLLPKAIIEEEGQKYKGVKFDGCIVYKLGVPNADIPAEAADDESLKKEIWRTIKQITGDEADCRKVPSRKECGYCDITCENCDERIG